MQNVTINNKKYGVDSETKLSLTNGALVIHRNRLGDVLGAYLVTSFRYNRGVTTEKAKEATQSYCSLINLDTGYLAFEERASRSTTIQRILSHLNKGDYYGQQAVKEGQYVEVYYSGEYKIDLQFERKTTM